MVVYDFIVNFYNTYPTLWLGLPEGGLILLLLPLLIPFVWTLMQHFSERYWRFSDRATALEYALSQIRPRSRLQRLFNRYFTAIFVLDLVLILFAWAHGAALTQLLTPERVVIWGIAWGFRFFIKLLKRALQDTLRDQAIGWAKQKFNDILALASDFFVLCFIADKPHCRAFFDKIFIFPEAKAGSLALESFGPLCFDVFHLNGAALVEDSSLFQFEGKDNIVIHTKESLRNLLKLDYCPEIAEQDEDLLAVVAGLPYQLLKSKTANTTWDCVRQVAGEEEDSVEQYERDPFDSEHFEHVMPYLRGTFAPGIPRTELFLEYVTKIVSAPSSLELFWHGNAGAPTWIPLYPRNEGELITDRIQHVIRKHRRAKLADTTVTEHLVSYHLPTSPDESAMSEVPGKTDVAAEASDAETPKAPSLEKSPETPAEMAPTEHS